MEDQTKIKEVSSRRLNICHISDLHGHHEDVTVSECDVLVCSGDISMIGHRKEVESFFYWFKRQAGRYKILVAGNHDLSFDPQRGENINNGRPSWLLRLLIDFEEAGNNYYLWDESCEIEGVKFWGSPTSAWFHGDIWAFNVREDQAEALYSTIPLGTDVVITHGPSYSNGDWCENVNGPVGDLKLTQHLYRVKPLLHLFGHIHESYSSTRVKDTYFFNGCNCGLDYQIHNEPWQIVADFDTKEVKILNKNQ